MPGLVTAEGGKMLHYSLTYLKQLHPPLHLSLYLVCVCHQAKLLKSCSFHGSQQISFPECIISDKLEWNFPAHVWGKVSECSPLKRQGLYRDQI